MTEKYQLINETLGYQTANDEGNEDPRFLTDGTKNIIIDRFKRFGVRSGYTRLGASNTALTEVRTTKTWNTSTGVELPIRMYDDELEVYLATVDTVVIDAWKRVLAGWSVTEKMRFATWWNATEAIDELLMVIGDDNHYKWNGAVAVVASVTSNSITKDGTKTFGEARFYASGNKTLINVRTGTEFAYTGGEGTLTLTSVTGDPTADGMVAGDILVQKVVTETNEPLVNRNHHTIGVFENQVQFGSESSNEVFVTSNSDTTDTTFSSPRVAGEGFLLTLDSPNKAFASIGKRPFIFSGRNSIFTYEFEQITVSSTLAETVNVRQLDIGVEQGAQSQEVVIPIGDQLAYLSFEPALRIISNPDELEGLRPLTISNPIKPDFDAEDWTNAQGIWHKNRIYLSAPDTNSKVYILEFVQDADGNLRRFWQPPQVLPVKSFSIISGNIYGHSNVVPETYLLFNGFSDTASDDTKLPIESKAISSYRNYENRANLKAFDEYYVEGLIASNVNDLLLTLQYDYGGATQEVTKTINGVDDDITYETLIDSSLGQQPLGQSPLGGAFEETSDLMRFRVIFEVAPEDLHELRVFFETNSEDRRWFILSHGANVRESFNRNITIHK